MSFVYDMKHDGRHKARMVAGGHRTSTPTDLVYSGVVSLAGIHAVTFLAELNDLELWGTDIGNAYLESYTKEKVAFIAGPEFGDLQGHTMINRKSIVWAKNKQCKMAQQTVRCTYHHGVPTIKSGSRHMDKTKGWTL